MRSFFIILGLLAQVSVFAQGITARIAYDIFQDSTAGSVLECRLLVQGSSLTFSRDNDSKEKARVETTIIFTQHDKVVAYDKYEMQSDKKGFDLFDIRRFALPDGDYLLEVMLQDLNNEKSRTVHYADSIHVQYIKDEIVVGPVILYDETQDPSSRQQQYRQSLTYSEETSKIRFYCPVYNSSRAWGLGAKMAVRYSIRNADTQVALEQFILIQRKQAEGQLNLSGDFPIDKLPTGRYLFCIEILDSTGKFVTSNQAPIVRENSWQMLSEDELYALATEGTFVHNINSKDTLKEMISCLAPISTNPEVVFAQNVLKEGDVKKMRQYILSFWQRRYGINAETGWKKYLVGVNGAIKEFSTQNAPGYRTDRGRVYLHYGPPNTITKRYDEPSAYPYEIWHYYKLEGQTNVRFIFYNNTGFDNNFVLLHSDLRGEINNRQWEMFIFNRNNSYNVDQNNVIRHYGNWSSDLYRQPR